MNTWENAVVTNKGIALLAKLIAGKTLNITRGETGSGYDTPGLLVKKESVTSPMQQLSFRGVSYDEDGTCSLSCYITNVGLDVAYTANQIGIYATDPDEGEILFFIAQAISGKGEDVPSESEMPGYSSEWTFYFKYGQADGVSINVNPSNTVSVEMFNKGMAEKANSSTKIVDNDIFQTKTIPEQTAPYAKINKIGGMTHRDTATNTLKEAKVTAVRSIGVNMANIQDRTETVKNSYYIDTPLGIRLDLNSKYTISMDYEVVSTDATALSLGVGYGENAFQAGIFDKPYPNMTSGKLVVTITTPTKWLHSNKAWVRLVRGNAPHNSTVKISNFMFVKGTVLPSSFVPYEESILSVPSDVQALDGYGLGVNENCYNYVAWNPEDNIKTWNKKCDVVDLGALTWFGSTYNDVKYFCYKLTPMKENTDSTLLANYEKTYGAPMDKQYSIGWDKIGSKYLCVRDDTYANVETFKAAMSGVMLVYELETPIVTDISDILTSDNLIEVFEGGMLIAENENGLDVPYEVIFYNGKNDIVGSQLFVGDLIGTAARAVCDKNGNPIHKSYAPATFVSEAIYVSSAGDTLAGLQQIYAEMPDQTAKVVLINHGVSDSLPLGGVWHAMIYKTSNDYGVITAITYNLGMSCKLAISNGTWGNWKVTSKVSGSYTGNNSAVERKINIGVTDSMLLINSDNGMVLVTGRGAICKPRLDNTVHGLPSYQCRFQDGILTIASDDATVNGSVTYWYDTL
jgi:hypothetical protein